jgi:ABC-type nitrate/sulfonate/bicarbonate transport system permease component
VKGLLKTRWSGLVLIALLLVCWELLARSQGSGALAFPPFSRVFATFWSLIANGTSVSILWPSLERLVAGYMLALVLGVGVGVAMGYFQSVYALLEPLTEVLRPIPVPAYIPIAILFLGLDNEMKIFVIAFSSFFPILLNTYSGVRAVDIIQINTARTFGKSASAILLKVILPAALPQIFTGMRISLAISLIMVVISEMVASIDGIGFYILNAQRTFRVPEMYAGVMMLGLLGYALNLLFVQFERVVLRWHFEANDRA